MIDVFTSSMKNFLLLLCLFVVANVAVARNAAVFFEQGRVNFLDIDWVMDVEVALTERQRSLGLMYRRNLAPDTGMLFVFDQVAKQRVWMKNTLIPLDIVFISATGKVVSFYEKLSVCKKMNCPIYNSKVQAKYMLEMNAGMIKKAGIALGQSVLLYIKNRN